MANANTIEKVADLIHEIFPQFIVKQEPENCVSITGKYHERIFWFNQKGENWSADIYEDAEALAAGEIEDSIETTMPTKSQNVVKTADVLITCVVETLKAYANQV